jgi:hypothetical protein
LASLEEHLAYLDAEYAAAKAAPLSARRAMLVALLVDAYADRLFAAQPEPDDVLVYRAGLAAASPALSLVFALAAQRSDVRLLTEAVEIPLAEYGNLPVEDFMVSLYNAHTVQRVRIALSDGGRLDVHVVLAEAIEALRTRTRCFGTFSPP